MVLKTLQNQTSFMTRTSEQCRTGVGNSPPIQRRTEGQEEETREGTEGNHLRTRSTEHGKQVVGE